MEDLAIDEQVSESLSSHWHFDINPNPDFYESLASPPFFRPPPNPIGGALTPVPLNVLRPQDNKTP